MFQRMTKHIDVWINFTKDVITHSFNIMKVHYNNPACIMIVFISKLRHYIKLIGIHSTKLFKGVIEHLSRLSSLSKLEKM